MSDDLVTELAQKVCGCEFREPRWHSHVKYEMAIRAAFAKAADLVETNGKRLREESKRYSEDGRDRDASNTMHRALACKDIAAELRALAEPQRESVCPRCEGTGKYSRLPGQEKLCAVCNGTGQIRETSRGRATSYFK
jgi:DnaJ-class molecular chaperone